MPPETVFPGNGVITYEPRTYRTKMGLGRFVPLEVCFRESDLWIGVDRECADRIGEQHLREKIALKLVQLHRILEDYGKRRKEFLYSLKPIPRDDEAVPLVQEMIQSAETAGTGPMAGVAGAVAGEVGRYLMQQFQVKEFVVENGGDIFLKVEDEIVISVFAGNSSLSGKIRVHVRPELTPLGICTSSGTVGHSFSFGKADAVMAASRNPVLADALATAFCNAVKDVSDVDSAASRMEAFDDLVSGVVIMGDRAGLFGDLKITFTR